MKKLLTTERTYLREMTEADYDDLCEILQDPQAMYAYEHAFDDAEGARLARPSARALPRVRLRPVRR